MSEPTPPPEAPASPPDSTAPVPDAAAKARTARRKCNWHRVRVYSLAILIVLALWFTGVFMEMRLQPLKATSPCGDSSRGDAAGALQHGLQARLFSSSTLPDPNAARVCPANPNANDQECKWRYRLSL